MAVQLYGGQVTLSPNMLYIVNLQIEGVELHQIRFTSRYSPLYSNVKVIRSDTGTMLQDVSTDAILYAIWQAGLYAQDLLVRKGLVTAVFDVDEQQEGVTDYLTIARNHQIKYAFEQYVRYRTDIDLITAIYLSRAGEAGSLEKKLGDLSVVREFKPTKLDDMLAAFRDEMSLWEGRLAQSGLVGSAVRAGRTSPYPLSGRRSF